MCTRGSPALVVTPRWWARERDAGFAGQQTPPSGAPSVFVASGLLLSCSSVFSPSLVRWPPGRALVLLLWACVSASRLLAALWCLRGGRTLDLHRRCCEDASFKGGFPPFFPSVSKGSRGSPFPADCWAPFHLPLRRQRTSLDPDGARHSVLCAQRAGTPAP